MWGAASSRCCFVYSRSISIVLHLTLPVWSLGRRTGTFFGPIFRAIDWICRCCVTPGSAASQTLTHSETWWLFLRWSRTTVQHQTGIRHICVWCNITQQSCSTQLLKTAVFGRLMLMKIIFQWIGLGSECRRRPFSEAIVSLDSLQYCQLKSKTLNKY